MFWMYILFLLLIVVAFVLFSKIKIQSLDKYDQIIYLKFPKGTVIVCPDCGKEIATAKRDIYSNETALSSAWDGIPECSRIACPECKASYGRNNGPYGELHTKNGWIGSPT